LIDSSLDYLVDAAVRYQFGCRPQLVVLCLKWLHEVMSRGISNGIVHKMTPTSSTIAAIP